MKKKSKFVKICFNVLKHQNVLSPLLQHSRLHMYVNTYKCLRNTNIYVKYGVNSVTDSLTTTDVLALFGFWLFPNKDRKLRKVLDSEGIFTSLV